MGFWAIFLKVFQFQEKKIIFKIGLHNFYKKPNQKKLISFKNKKNFVSYCIIFKTDLICSLKLKS